MDKHVEIRTPQPPQLMRDVVIDAIYAAAQKDRDVFFVCADLGAKALDDFRANLPDQFIHVGICEQNMVDFASGLALSGKKVFLYAMAPFITARAGVIDLFRVKPVDTAALMAALKGYGAVLIVEEQLLRWISSG